MPKDSKNVSKVIIMNGTHCLFLDRIDGNGWELPGGHLNMSEKYITGGIREVYEETGIKLNRLKPLIREKDFMLFVANVKSTKVTISNEHKGYRWCTYAQILKLNTTRATKRNLKMILKIVKAVQ
jgi:8-oxo-dGTP pyrophosphatase MutT (NUDIX family)